LTQIVAIQSSASIREIRGFIKAVLARREWGRDRSVFSGSVFSDAPAAEGEVEGEGSTDVVRK
jgi:hypothetical protein